MMELKIVDAMWVKGPLGTARVVLIRGSRDLTTEHGQAWVAPRSSPILPNRGMKSVDNHSNKAQDSDPAGVKNWAAWMRKHGCGVCEP